MSEPDDDIGEIANPVGKEEGPDDAPALKSVPSGTTGRRERKPLNKDLLARAADSVRRHLEGDDGDDMVVAPTGAPSAKADEPPPATPPPAAAPPSDLTADRARIAVARAQLEERARTLVERERRARDVAARFADDPWGVIQDLVRHELGTDATEDEIAEETAYQVTQLSLRVAGANVDPQNQAHALRSVKRELARQKATTRRKEQQLEERREAEARAAKERDAVAAVAAEFEALAPKHPWLAAAERPAEILWDVIRREHERSGTILEIAEAAKLADDYLAQQDRQWYERRKGLLTPQTAAPTAPQGDPRSRSRTLANATASDDAPPPPEVPGRLLSKEERRRATFDRWKPKLRDMDD